MISISRMNRIASLTSRRVGATIRQKGQVGILSVIQAVQLPVERHFSSSPPKNIEENKPPGTIETIRSNVMNTVFSKQTQFYGLVTGGTFGAYIISKGFLSLTSFFSHLNPTIVAKYGFYTGFGTASLLGGLIAVTVDNLYIRADPVYRYCFNWVDGDERVIAGLGDGLKAGNLRSYRLDSGKFEMDGKVPIWRPPRIQMIFDVTGTGPPYRTGLVTCEAVKKEGLPPTLSTTLLMVDYETGNEGDGGAMEGDKTIFLVGNEEQITKISNRSGVSLEMLARQVHINRAVAAK
eukprot:CAMPEP_0171298014 /NCGR_PEP_ID=MMETSP0816-20121228/6779_1 /TAXON_ID=420281 /ORGANISM="Proboscia inermis, Strain CCAP1064/1" /LENGTH=291 /DNA_ID=CAMNT_0011772749 /DNA_START=42 /DNA_END=917 /DNA_ORIENTATION=+